MAAFHFSDFDSNSELCIKKSYYACTVWNKKVKFWTQFEFKFGGFSVLKIPISVVDPNPIGSGRIWNYLQDPEIIISEPDPNSITKKCPDIFWEPTDFFFVYFYALLLGQHTQHFFKIVLCLLHDKLGQIRNRIRIQKRYGSGSKIIWKVGSESDFSDNFGSTILLCMYSMKNKI